MDNNYTVYIHIFPNNKVYVGITCRTPKYRWNNGKNYKTQELMFRAIKKYGWDNIEHKILFENLSKEQAEQKEIELIAQYKSTQREFGYNVENGGNCKGTVNEETKEKISKNNAKYWLGKKLSEETKEKMSKNMKNKKVKKESIIKGLKTKKERFPDGIPISEEERQRRSIKMKNNKISAKPILQINKNGNLIKKWNCISDASRELNINNGSIVSCAKFRRKTAGGFIWRYENENKGEYIASDMLLGGNI